MLPRQHQSCPHHLRPSHSRFPLQSGAETQGPAAPPAAPAHADQQAAATPPAHRTRTLPAPGSGAAAAKLRRQPSGQVTPAGCLLQACLHMLLAAGADSCCCNADLSKVPPVRSEKAAADAAAGKTGPEPATACAARRWGEHFSLAVIFYSSSAAQRSAQTQNVPDMCRLGEGQGSSCC